MVVTDITTISVICTVVLTVLFDWDHHTISMSPCLQKFPENAGAVLSEHLYMTECMCMSMYACMYVFVCVCVWERENVRVQQGNKITWNVISNYFKYSLFLKSKFQ